MANDLTEIGERIQFCRNEITILAAEIDVYSARGVEFRQEDHGDMRMLYARLLEAVPTHIRARSGTIANELRSCLDALACQLAIRNKQTTKNVYFPISQSHSIFNSDGLRKIRKLSKADQTTIISLKPYPPDRPILFGLHELDRNRKHIKLGSWVGQASANPFAMGRVGFARIKCSTSVFPLNKVGEEVLVATAIAITGRLEGTFTVGFLEPEEAAGMPVVEQLRAFASEVEGIVSKF